MNKEIFNYDKIFLENPVATAIFQIVKDRDGSVADLIFCSANKAFLELEKPTLGRRLVGKFDRGCV